MDSLGFVVPMENRSERLQVCLHKILPKVVVTNVFVFVFVFLLPPQALKSFLSQ
jgi:hypothetical protein